LKCTFNECVPIAGSERKNTLGRVGAKPASACVEGSDGDSSENEFDGGEIQYGKQ
jgi:hypothetical protein